MSRRVVISGLGLVSPLGLDEETVWANLMAGRTGIRRITAFDANLFRAANGAEVDAAALDSALAARGWKGEAKVVDMALVAADQALRAAKLISDDGAREPQPVPVIIGSANGPAAALHEAIASYIQKGVRGIRPTTVPQCMVNIVATRLSIEFKLTGIHYNISAACTSSATAMGNAFRMIRDGYADRVLCGGAEFLFVPSYYSAWNNLGILSSEPDPLRAARPFDLGRKGFVMGAGAAMLVMEEEASARRRGVRIRGEICGYGESSDAEHIVRPQAAGQTQALRHAMSDSGLAPDTVGLIVSHGTATLMNDRSECAAIRSFFGEITTSSPRVSALKSYFGHTIGASGAIETVVTLLALERGRIPPNLNIDQPDPECDVRLVGKSPEPLEKPVAVKQSFGFGGANGVMVMRRWDG
jgi:3-oxoacyl-[acyl-carrier-protein] synthase II